MREGSKVLTVRAPTELARWLSPLPKDARSSNRFRHADIALVFAVSTAEVDLVMSRVLGVLPAEGAVWVGWPKKASGIVSELQSRDVMLSGLFERGPVDVEVAAMSHVWSDLKFVVRNELR